MSTWWNLCVPQPASPDDVSQETKIYLDEHTGSVAATAGPTLMQSKRSAWGQTRLFKASCACAPADRSQEANFGLDMLRRMAEAEDGGSTTTVESRPGLTDAVDSDVVKLMTSPRPGTDEVHVDGASSTGLISLASLRSFEKQLDAEQQQVIADDLESPSNPPSSARAALLREAEDREAREARNRLEREAIERSNAAREERELKEKVRGFLSAHGYRHVRAKCSHTTMSKTYALHCAVWCNDVDMTRLLLSSRADPTQANGWGQTALQYAQRRNSKQGSHLAILELLVAGGADRPSDDNPDKEA